MLARIAYGSLVGAGLVASASSCIDIPSVVSVSTEAGTPVAFVQAQTINAGADSAATLSLGNPIAAHDALVLCFVYDGASVAPQGTTPIEDTLGNTYNLVVGPATGDGTVYVAIAADSAPGRDTVTVKLTGSSSSYFEVYAHEYSGLATSTPFEDGSFGTGTSSATDGMASGPITTTSAESLLFGCGQAPGVASSGTGFTLRTSFDGNVTEDALVHGAGTHMATATLASAAPPGLRWAMLGAAFRGQ